MPVVSGRVTDHAGQGVAGVYVSALPAEGGRFGRAPGTHTDLTGRWRLELAAGAWTVRETGHAVHTLRVGDLPVDVDSTAATAPAPVPTRDELERLMSRRRGRGDDYVSSVESAQVDEETRLREREATREAYMAEVASTVTSGDSQDQLGRLLSRRRSTREET